MEDYKKKYEAVLQRAKDKLESAKVFDYDDEQIAYDIRSTIFDVFPELKENEDENIRKTLIDFFNRGAENGAQTNGVCDKDIIAWLEKQGEQVSAIRWYDASFIPQEYKELLVEWNSSDTTWHDVAFYHADTKTFKSYERELKNVTRWCYVDDLFGEQSNVKETGISQHDEKTCVEWSEEDKVILDEIIDFFENGTVKLQHDLSLYASWLKSLKQRYTWKPSDEQIKAVRLARSFVVDDFGEHPILSEILVELEEQLKKLKA